jgi:hypothetical protein
MIVVIVCNVLLFVSIVALIVSNFKLWVELKAMQSSTHKVQLVNVPNNDFQKMTDELREKLKLTPYDNIL